MDSLVSELGHSAITQIQLLDDNDFKVTLDYGFVDSSHIAMLTTLTPKVIDQFEDMSFDLSVIVMPRVPDKDQEKMKIDPEYDEWDPDFMTGYAQGWINTMGDSSSLFRQQ